MIYNGIVKWKKQQNLAKASYLSLFLFDFEYLSKNIIQ